MMTPQIKAITDIDRLLAMMCQKFPLPFSVAKGGDELRIQLEDGGEITLNRDGTWGFAKLNERSN